jgi:hypothetical protein
LIRLSSALLTILFNIVSVAAIAAARCDELTTDGNIWNLICAADEKDEYEDVYQCDYFVSMTYSNGLSDQQEATGAVSPGQSGVVIWSSTVYGDDTHIVAASIASGSCTR